MITADELAVLLSASDRVRVLDVRWSLGGPPGLPLYRDGHIPGAVYVDLESELAAHGEPTEGRHPLPAVAALQDAARRWGLNTGDTVVVYDDLAGMSAARAWWLLRYAGVEDVRLLDGALSAWQSAGHPLRTGDEP
ncbi:MAG TPA: rhodanese-like domain-containing protein, partial [Terrimesophilobacter sp.]|nr:rhodanese-like domain-containing protein [Terrimesophilobacter sp.]